MTEATIVCCPTQEVTQPVTTTATARTPLLRVLPSFTDLAFLLPIFVLFAIFEGPRKLLSDCDTGWHIRTGDWILQHGQVPYKDLFSFSKPNGDWFAWEWGWDVLASLIHKHWALSGVVLVNALLLGVVSVLLYRLVRKRAENDLLALLLTMVAMLGSSLHWLARPHLVSWVLFLVFLHLIERAQQGNSRLLWYCPLLTMLWVNLHGSFFLGAGLLLIYGVANTVQALVSCEHSVIKELGRQRIYFLTASACLIASLANPYGWQLHKHVFRYLTDSKQLGIIAEYSSISFHSPLAICVELFLVLGFCSAFRALQEKQLAQAVIVLLWAHLALRSARNIPIFLFVAAPPSVALLAACLKEMQRSAIAAWLRNAAGRWTAFCREFEALERVERIPVLPAGVALFLAAGLGVSFGAPARINDFDARDFPVAATSLLVNDHGARVFTFDQWGDYLIYRLFPKTRVFVDGRSDFYGAEFGKKWVKAVEGGYDWRSEFSKFAIDTVLLRTSDPLSSVLKQSREWKTVFDDGNAIVFKVSSGSQTGRKDLWSRRLAS